MIALNELLNNIEKFDNVYKAMGLKENLNYFVELENKRKQIQLEAEKLRSDCNKLCSEIASLRKDNLDTKPQIKKIKTLNKKIKNLQKQLDYYGDFINFKLKFLKNIPAELNERNIQIETKGNSSTFNEFCSFLKSFIQSKHTFHSLNSNLKKQRNRIFQQNELPTCTFLRNGITILVADYEIDEYMNKLFDYFNKNAMNMIKISFKQLQKSSTAEYMVQLNPTQHIRVELKREFFTREYKIKYKNTSIDMTKFVNQIDIVYL